MRKLCAGLVAAACFGLFGPAAALQRESNPTGLTVNQVRAMDADRDGRITAEEYDALSSDQQLWADLDRNADGVLDAQEIRAGIQVPYRTTR